MTTQILRSAFPVFFDARSCAQEESSMPSSSGSQAVSVTLQAIGTQKLDPRLSTLVVPAQLKPKEEIQTKLEEGRNRLLNHFHGTSIQILTRDGAATLDGMFIPKTDTDPTSPDLSCDIFIYCMGNGGRFETEGLSTSTGILDDKGEEIRYDDASLSDLCAKGNVVLINYRGVSRSEGEVNHEGLVDDVASTYLYVRQELGVDEERITLFGHSLGGCIVAYVAQEFPKANVVIDRSPISMGEAMKIIVADEGDALEIFKYWNHPIIAALQNRNDSCIASLQGRVCITCLPSGDPKLLSSAISPEHCSLRDISWVAFQSLEELHDCYKADIQSKRSEKLSPEEEGIIEGFVDRLMKRNMHGRRRSPEEIAQIFRVIFDSV